MGLDIESPPNQANTNDTPGGTDMGMGLDAGLSPRMHNFIRSSVLTLSAIGLLADILGIGKLAYDVIVAGQLVDLAFKLMVLVVVFLFGTGLGVLGIKGFRSIPSLYVIARFYSWVYLAIACLSYLGIAFTLYTRNYTFGTYVAFVSVIQTELLAIYALHVVIPKHDLRHFSIPILAVCSAHVILIVYTYVFAAVPVSLYLTGDLLFFTGMTLVGTTMLGDFGFRTMLSRLWREINKSIPTDFVQPLLERLRPHSRRKKQAKSRQAHHAEASNDQSLRGMAAQGKGSLDHVAAPSPIDRDSASGAKGGNDVLLPESADQNAG